MRVGIVGCGVAGRARAKAVHAHPEATLVGVHRGRFAHTLGAPELDADALLRTSELIIVASPSDTHEGWVRRGLEAGCHVVVEYPLARDETSARACFAAADACGRVLHVEHIERLSPTTMRLAEAVRAYGVGERSTLRFVGRGLPFEDGGVHAWHQVSRLHRIACVLGWPDAVDVHEANGARLRADVRVGAHTVSFEAVRDPSARRGLTWSLPIGGTTWDLQGRRLLRDGEDVPLPETRLFYDDLEVALACIRGDGQHYVSRQDVLSGLRWAAALA